MGSGELVSVMFLQKTKEKGVFRVNHAWVKRAGSDAGSNRIQKETRAEAGLNKRPVRYDRPAVT
jgi:hypothetical protein